MEGKRWRVICGESISCGSGDWRRVGRRSWMTRSARTAISIEPAKVRGGACFFPVSVSVRLVLAVPHHWLVGCLDEVLIL